MKTLHLAGAYEDQVQRCARCGEILIDNRNGFPATFLGPPQWVRGTIVGQSERGFWLHTLPQSEINRSASEFWCEKKS